MTAPGGPSTGGPLRRAQHQRTQIFICYRRDDTAAYAGRIYDRLAVEFGRDQVFIDVDQIPLGEDFVDHIEKSTARCARMLAVIGQHWLRKDEAGRRRIDDPNDFVRLELEVALRREIPIVPVLVELALLPSESELPASIRKLSRRQALRISHAGFHDELSRLIRQIRSERPVDDALVETRDGWFDPDRPEGTPSPPAAPLDDAPPVPSREKSPQAAAPTAISPAPLIVLDQRAEAQGSKRSPALTTPSETEDQPTTPPEVENPPPTRTLRSAWMPMVIVLTAGTLLTSGATLMGSAWLRSRSSAATPPASAELATSRLLDDEERMRALIALVHAGGEESPELADLVNEDAAVVYEVMERKCEGPGDLCELPAPTVSGTLRASTSQLAIKHLFEQRKVKPSDSKPGGAVPAWLAGLTIPAIGAQDDPRVRSILEYYTQNQVGRNELQNMLFRCGAYRDLIEKALVIRGLPRALFAVVMTESFCLPNAESPVGGRGLWQLLPATARAYHLNVIENVVDERLSPPKSSEAAVKLLADLHRKMGNWELALAAYNMGPFNLAAIVRRAGNDVTFWDLAAAGLLSEETTKYVPRVEAYALILENLAHFNFSTAQMRVAEVTVGIPAPAGTRLGMVARAAGTSLDHLELLNPDFIRRVVPYQPGSSYIVHVPQKDFVRTRSLLEQLLEDDDNSDRCVSSAFDWGTERFSPSMCDAQKKAR